MRKIILEIETDSNEDIEELKRDLACEISCCSSFFETDTMIIKEKSEQRNLNFDKDNVIAGLAEINAFCKVVSQIDKEVSNELVKRWERYTNEAIKLLNEND